MVFRFRWISLKSVECFENRYGKWNVLDASSAKGSWRRRWLTDSSARRHQTCLWGANVDLKFIWKETLPVRRVAFPVRWLNLKCEQFTWDATKDKRPGCFVGGWRWTAKVTDRFPPQAELQPQQYTVIAFCQMANVWSMRPGYTLRSKRPEAVEGLHQEYGRMAFLQDFYSL